MNAPAFPYGHSLKPMFHLRSDMIYLNHGAYGATLRDVLDYQRGWVERMEAQPARFFMKDLPGLIRQAVEVLAPEVGADPVKTVMVENATSGVNAILRSLNFQPGDRIVTTDHVYNAVRNILRYVVDRVGAEFVEVPVAMPLADPGSMVERILRECNSRTRLVVVDHIASPSGIVFPVDEIVRLCQSKGIQVLVDGSHAPGMIEPDIGRVGADWYVGNCHKWMGAPKGAAFIAVGPANETEIHPSIISHAYGKGLVDEFAKIGTRDASAWLSVPFAIEAHGRLGGRAMRARNRQLAIAGGRAVAGELGTEMGAPESCFGAMTTVRIPAGIKADHEAAAKLREALWSDHRIDAIVAPISGALWVRLCAYAYNQDSDFSSVAGAIRDAVKTAGWRERS
ncbi:aminotransferase class V-fold PLP-dependent enzyme [Mesorhizobium sp. Z1-4]|uniref:aminotransferase class V-fold PLP-dependent enzyme n=1 Tax=Mesorhizobium sp. Z1-4 TaxID=2448478 RepID=UPI000FD9AD1B|nr:aminotransferase class V-fold PLP-dependent enzyme [Mesorhizobium sp. Z1-4]